MKQSKVFESGVNLKVEVSNCCGASVGEDEICRECKEHCSVVNQKTYNFTREVKAWGVEAGDTYNEKIHMYKGGTEKLLEEGIIEEENE